MGIQALPQKTVGALGASQVLIDSASVIKELIDNALDARATSIAIEISGNTIDTIQVRDNGHGIPPESRQLVARPHCTSKIASEDDLKDIGRTSLGFRGEALASVAEMSGSLVISTRVEGEQVATGLKINQQGEVVAYERASLPIGTTVKIADFVKANPVRRQVALKNTEKCLKKIKQMLQSYAFARPHVRLSLRIQRINSDKGNWTYAPKAGGIAEDATFKIVGSECASQCTWSVIEDEGFALQAFLPRLDSQTTKISNIGSFISVDARPVSAGRGTPKQIVKIFREALKKASADFDGVKEPFIYLEIACPSASYDANVEPAKDDVLFENPDIVVRAARNLLEAVYPPHATASRPKQTPIANGASQKALVNGNDDFATSLETPSNESSSLRLTGTITSGSMADLNSAYRIAGSEIHCEMDNGISDGRHAFRTTMYGCDEEDLDLIEARPPTGRTEAEFEEVRQAHRDINASSPWVLAKLNAPRRHPATPQMDTEAPPLNPCSSVSQDRSPLRRSRPLIDLETPALPTPRPSSPMPHSQNFHPSDYVPDVRLARDGRLIGSQSLPAPSPFYTREEGGARHEHSPRQSLAYDYTLSSQSAGQPTGTPLDAIPDVSRPSRRSPRKQLQQTRINKPFVQPATNQSPREKVWFDNIEEGNKRPRRPKRHLDQNNDLVSQCELGALVENPRPLTPPRRNRNMRDFVTSVDLTADDSIASLIESRDFPAQKCAHPTEQESLFSKEHDENKTPANGVLSGHGFISATKMAEPENSNPVMSQPHKRRKTNESRVLRQLSVNSGAPDNLDDEDYNPSRRHRTKSLRRRTTDGSISKVRRTKSARLPLESIPTGQGTKHLIFNLPTAIGSITQIAGKVDEEKSVLRQKQPPLIVYDTLDISSSPEEIQDLTAKLHVILINRFSDGEMVQDLGVLLQNAFAAHAKAVAGAEAIRDP